VKQKHLEKCKIKGPKSIQYLPIHHYHQTQQKDCIEKKICNMNHSKDYNRKGVSTITCSLDEPSYDISYKLSFTVKYIN